MDEFVNEEDIATANKKYKDILKYCLNDDHTKPVYPEKDSVMTKIKLRIKRNFRDIVMNGKRYKAEIREKDNQKIEVLLGNWSHKSKTKDDKED